MRVTDTVLAMCAVMLPIALGFGQPACATEPQETVRAVVRLADKQMPLPHGDWVLAGRGVQAVPEESSGPFGVMRTAILLLLSGDRVTAIAEFNTNDVPVSGGWNAPAACDSTNAEPHLVRYRSELDFACVAVDETRIDTGGPSAWQDATAFIARNHLRKPDTMLTASFAFGDRQDIVDARLHFDPAEFSAHDKARQMLLAWAAHFAPEFEKGIANQLAGPPIDGPLRSALLSDSPELDRRLFDLETLQRTGAISAADALRQQQAVLSERPRSAEGDVLALDGWYYMISTPLINLVTAYGVTQSGPLAIAITLTEQAARSLVYVANQASWDHATTQATQHKTPWPTLMHIGAIDLMHRPAS